MTLPQAAPEGHEESPRGEHFSNSQPKPGTTYHAYIAGPTMWFWCHEPKRTKPCLKIMTNGAVTCPWCGTEKEVKQKGYVPIYRAVDSAPRNVLVNDTYRDTLARFKLHDRVTFGKEGEQGDPVWVIKALTQTPAFQTTLRCRQREIDLTESLLRIWQNADLVRWYRELSAKNKRPGDNRLSLPPGTAVRDNGEPFSPMNQSAAKMVGATVVPPADDDEQAEADRRMLEAVQRGAAPATNGKHKRKVPPKG